jgi:excisionase family DNA binding protein
MRPTKNKKGKEKDQGRAWDDWQKYVRRETQRLKGKSSGQVVSVKFADQATQQTTQQNPPAKQEASSNPEDLTRPHEFEGRRPPVPGVPREEAVQVSDDEIGKTVRPFTVSDYRNIRPLASPDLFETSNEPDDGGVATDVTEVVMIEEIIEIDEDIPIGESVEPLVTDEEIESASADLVPTEVIKQAPPKKVKEIELKDTQTDKHKSRKKKDSHDGELELFGSVSDRQTITRQRLARKSKIDREELIDKLLDPVISLEEAATLIGVCKTTLRRYTNSGELECIRTPGQQRRFKLSQVLEFVKTREGEQKTRKSRKKKVE